MCSIMMKGGYPLSEWPKTYAYTNKDPFIRPNPSVGGPCGASKLIAIIHIGQPGIVLLNVDFPVKHHSNYGLRT